MVKITKPPLHAKSPPGTRPVGADPRKVKGAGAAETDAFRASGALPLTGLGNEPVTPEAQAAFAKQVIEVLRSEATQAPDGRHLIDPLVTLQTYYPSLKVASGLVEVEDPVISGGARAFTTNLALAHPPDLARLIERAGGMEHTAVREPSGPAGNAVYTPGAWDQNQEALTRHFRTLPDAANLAFDDATVGRFVETEYQNNLSGGEIWSGASGVFVLLTQWKPLLRNFIRAEELKPGTVHARFRALFGADKVWPVDDETAALLRRAAGVFKFDEALISYGGKTLAEYKVAPAHQRPLLKPLPSPAGPAVEPSRPALNGVPIVSSIASANWVAVYEGRPVPHPQAHAIDDAGVFFTTNSIGGSGETIHTLRDHHVGPRGALAPDWATALRNATRAQELTGVVDIERDFFASAPWPATPEAAALLRRAAKAYGVSEQTIAFNGSQLDRYTGRPVPKASDLMSTAEYAHVVSLPPAERPAALAAQRRAINTKLGMLAPLPDDPAFRDALRAARRASRAVPQEQRDKLFASIQPEPHLGVAMALSVLLDAGAAPLQSLVNNGFSKAQVDEAASRAAVLSSLSRDLKHFLTDGLVNGREDFQLFAAREILATAETVTPDVIEAATHAGAAFDPTLTLKAVVDRAMLGTEADREAVRGKLKTLVHEGYEVTDAVAGHVESLFPQAVAEVTNALETFSQADVVTREAALKALRTKVHAYGPVFDGGSALLARALRQMFDAGLEGRVELAAVDAAEPGGVKGRAWQDPRPVRERLKLDKPAADAVPYPVAQASYPAVAHQLRVLKASLEYQAGATADGGAPFDLEGALFARALKVLDTARVEPQAHRAFTDDLLAWAQKVRLELSER